jgi:hypothetical protein
MVDMRSETVNEAAPPRPPRPFRRARRETHPGLVYGFLFLIAAVVGAGVRIWVLEKNIDRLESQVGAYADQIVAMQREMSDALVRGAPRREVNERDVQALRAHHPEEAEILGVILSLQREGVAWSGTGDSRSTGFHSAAFVAHVLRTTGHTMGFLELVADASASRDRLYQSLRYKEAPSIGDLVFYPGDLVFFYLADRAGRPFVIGMTPRGIRALEPSFTEPLGYREFRFAGRVRS